MLVRAKFDVRDVWAAMRVGIIEAGHDLPAPPMGSMRA